MKKKQPGESGEVGFLELCSYSRFAYLKLVEGVSIVKFFISYFMTDEFDFTGHPG